MTLEVLQAEMITAMKNKNKTRKDVLSSLVSAIKKAAIDRKTKDNITEALVNEVLLKEKKTMQEMIDTCPANRTETLAEYNTKMAIINEFAPQLLTDSEAIKEAITEVIKGSGLDLLIIKANKNVYMKVIMPAMKGKADMKIVNQVVNEMFV